MGEKSGNAAGRRAALRCRLRSGVHCGGGCRRCGALHGLILAYQALYRCTDGRGCSCSSGGGSGGGSAACFALVLSRPAAAAGVDPPWWLRRARRHVGVLVSCRCSNSCADWLRVWCGKACRACCHACCHACCCRCPVHSRPGCCPALLLHVAGGTSCPRRERRLAATWMACPAPAPPSVRRRRQNAVLPLFLSAL